jgi:hypothetical protein
MPTSEDCECIILTPSCSNCFVKKIMDKRIQKVISESKLTGEKIIKRE